MVQQRSDYTNFTVNVPHQAAWLVYINGLEIPVVDVDLSFGIWSVPQATLTLVPHVILQRIGYEDRLQVQIFYLDEFYDTNNPEFRLFHEYEVAGWSYTNTSTGRFIQLDCRSHLQIMKQLYFYYMSAVDDMIVANSPATATDAGLVTADMIYYPASLFLQGLVRPSAATLPGELGTTISREEFVTSPFEFISNVFRALLSEIDFTADYDAESGKIPSKAVSCPGRNFFGRWMNMTDFRRRWGGIPFFDDDGAKTAEGCFPLLKSLQSTEVFSAIQQQIGQSIGHSGSMWDLLKQIFGLMYMEVISIPGPPAVKLDMASGLLLGPIDKVKTGIMRNGPDTFGGILSNFVKPQCIFGIPPTCNIIFPSMISSYTYQEDYLSQPTRIYLGEQFMTNTITANAEGSVQALAREAVTTGYPPVVHNRMRLYITDPKQNTKNFLVYPEELFKGPVSYRANAPPWLYMLSKIQDALPRDDRTSAGALDTMGIKKTKEFIKPLVAKYGDQLGLPRALIFALIQRESGFEMGNESWDGGRGLMQIQIKNPEDADGNPIPWVRRNKKGEILLNKKGKPITKVTTDSSEFAWGLACDNFGGNKKDVPKGRELLDPDTNLKMGISLAHHYMVKRIKDVMKKKPNLKDLTDLGTIRAILSFKFGASPGSTIWKVGYNETTDRIYALERIRTKVRGETIDTKEKGDDHGSATKSFHNWRRAYKKWLAIEEAGGLDPPAQAAVPEGEQFNEAFENPYDQPVDPTEEPDPTLTQNLWGEEMSLASDPLAADIPLISAGLISEIGNLFELYARYEFYRKRFESRTGGVTLAFNPYIIPGFPAVVFDEKTSGFDTIGYVTSVRHKLSVARGTPQMSTTVSLSYMRSFPEFMGYLKQGFEESGFGGNIANLDCAPSEPIYDVYKVFQKQTKTITVEGQEVLDMEYPSADAFYSRMFYTGTDKRTPSGWYPSFHWRDMVEAYDLGGTLITDAGDFNLEDGLIVKPTGRYRREFRSYDAAMAYVARPACTLRDYIRLRHGKSIKKLLQETEKNKGGKLVASDRSYYSHNRDGGKGPRGGGAIFWARIDAYKQGPGSPTPEAIAAITNVDIAADYGPHASGKWTLLTAAAGVPQTRQNWDKMLQHYRRVVRGAPGNLAPQV